MMYWFCCATSAPACRRSRPPNHEAMTLRGRRARPPTTTRSRSACPTAGARPKAARQHIGQSAVALPRTAPARTTPIADAQRVAAPRSRQDAEQARRAANTSTHSVMIFPSRCEASVHHRQMALGPAARRRGRATDTPPPPAPRPSAARGPPATPTRQRALAPRRTGPPGPATSGPAWPTSSRVDARAPTGNTRGHETGCAGSHTIQQPSTKPPRHASRADCQAADHRAGKPFQADRQPMKTTPTRSARPGNRPGPPIAETGEECARYHGIDVDAHQVGHRGLARTARMARPSMLPFMMRSERQHHDHRHGQQHQFLRSHARAGTPRNRSSPNVAGTVTGAAPRFRECRALQQNAEAQQCSSPSHARPRGESRTAETRTAARPTAPCPAPRQRGQHGIASRSGPAP
ncbi:hypothetical protein FQR65_LT20565 [Abscondita terminalis]|nr:hypothetical protein FQR65_LT20565 [Abscondita terminalis]